MPQDETFWDTRSKRYDDSVQKHGSGYDNSITSTLSLLTESDVVLDFGCASGEYSLDLALHVQQVHGIDLSEAMIELAKQKARVRQVNNVSFNQVDVFDPGLADNSFTAIIAFNIFHLVEDLPRILARLNHLLPTGGLLISQTPCLGERGWLFRALINSAQKLGAVPPILSLTIAGLESFVVASNFDIAETRILDKKDKAQWIVARKC